jgi:hypothetical protein
LLRAKGTQKKFEHDLIAILSSHSYMKKIYIHYIPGDITCDNKLILYEYIFN